MVDEVNVFTFAFWNALVGTIVSAILMGTIEEPVILSGIVCNLLLIAHAIGTAQISVVVPWCLQYLTTSTVAMVESLHLVVLLVLQYTVLRDVRPGHENWVEVLGAVICFTGLVLGPTWHICKQRKVKDGVTSESDK